MAVVKIIELVGSSKTSTDDAAKQALTGAVVAAEHPRGRHRLDRDPRREPRRVPRPRAGRVRDRGHRRRLTPDTGPEPPGTRPLNTLIPIRICCNTRRAWSRRPRPRSRPAPPSGSPPSTSSTSITRKPQKGKGKLGSLENPEVYENVPGHVIPILEREFDDFDTEAGKFLDGQTPEDQFIGFRLKQGVYGQRQPDVQMIRVKLPMGGITPGADGAFADVIEDYAPLNKGHITTRQNIQIHHIPLPDAAKLIRAHLRRRPLLPRGLRQHRPQRHRRPVRRRHARASSSTSPPTPAPTSATSSATRRRS